MYAVIQTGGKQYKVAEGDRIDVELLEATTSTCGRCSSSTATACCRRRARSSGVSVTAPRRRRSAKGPKIRGFTYKNKSNQRRHWGHRQHYSTIEITAISKS